jgi:hypothetical protein
MQQIRKLLRIAVLAGAPLALAACDDARLASVNVGGGAGSAEASDVIGFWTGDATLSTAFGAPGDGETYRIALSLGQGGWFTLRSDYPPASGETRPIRRCDGVYSVRHGVIEFFADDLCPALPLTRLSVYVVRGSMVIEGYRTQPVSVRLRMDLWRS